MPGPAPKTDKWTARENKQQKPAVLLIVSGLVQVTNTSKSPRLTEPAGPSRKSQPLALDLSIATGRGPGNAVLVWKPASFSKKVAVDQHNGVDIRWDGKSIASCKVLDDSEHYQHLVQLTQAANAKVGQMRKPAARAKPKAVRRAKTKPKPAARIARKASRKKKR